MELCTKGLGTQTESLRVRDPRRQPGIETKLWIRLLCLAGFQARGVNLSCVRSCVVIAEERPRLGLTQSFSKLFKDVGLSPRAVSTAFGSRVNLAVCLQVCTTSGSGCTSTLIYRYNVNPWDIFFCVTGHHWSWSLYSVCGHEVSTPWQVRAQVTFPTSWNKFLQKVAFTKRKTQVYRLVKKKRKNVLYFCHLQNVHTLNDSIILACNAKSS